MNSYTETPVNTVIFDAVGALLMGLLAFAGEGAIAAVFTIGITALYVAYAIPMVARFLGKNDFKPGPFHLGVFVSFNETLRFRRAPDDSLLCHFAEPSYLNH